MNDFLLLLVRGRLVKSNEIKRQSQIGGRYLWQIWRNEEQTYIGADMRFSQKTYYIRTST